MSGGVRQSRLEGTIRKHLGAELGRVAQDPRLTALGIERVELSRDLSVATVLVRIMFGADDPPARKGALVALKAVSPGLRSSLAQILRMRRVPELRFVYDEGEDNRRRVDALLAEIHREPRGGDEPEAGPKKPSSN